MSKKSRAKNKAAREGQALTQQNMSELLQADISPERRATLEQDLIDKAFIGGGAGGQDAALAGLVTEAGRASEEIAGLGQTTQDLVDSFEFDRVDVDKSGLDQFSSIGSQGVDAFGQGVSGIQSLLADPSSILDDPLIQAQLQQGIGASEAGAAAGGTQLSGGQLKELQGLGQTFAGTQIDEQFGRLSGLANIGLQGAQFGAGLEQFGIETDLKQGAVNQAGLQQFQNAQLAGQADVSNLALEGVGVRADAQTAVTQARFDQAIGNKRDKAQSKANNTQAAVGLGTLALLAFSDRRVKNDITPVGELDNGLTVYEFKYKWDNETIHVGLMAQEVELVHPDAVVEINGVKAVNYSKAVM